MKKVVIVLLLFTMCKSENTQRSSDIVFNFNRLSSESFRNKNYISNKEFSDFSDQQKCFLEKTIGSYLDDLNSSSLLVLDSFFVRSYYSGVDGIHFSFISSANGNFYFMFSSQLERYKWKNSRAYSEDDDLLLKDSVGNFIVKLNIPLLDDFLTREINGSSSIHRQSEKISNLLGPIFPFLLNREIQLEEFQLAIGKKSENRFASITSVLNPLIYRTEYQVLKNRGNKNFQIFENMLGFVFVSYEPGLIKTNDLRLDIYFIPHDKRHGHFIKDAEAARYIDCLKKFNKS